MKMSYSNLTQSKYFSPAFNSAIFDGPLRIYFAQFHEAFALKVYFQLQNFFSEELAKAKEISKNTHTSVLVMIYPSQDNFLLSFDDEELNGRMVVTESWNHDYVIGLRQPLEDHQMPGLISEFKTALDHWITLNQEPVRALEL